MNGITYSWRISQDDVSAGFRFLYACGTPILASYSSLTFEAYTTWSDYSSVTGQAFKNSPNGASCSLYTFVASQNNTIITIESCSRMLWEPWYFTHSLIFQSGQVGFVCSSRVPILVSGTYTNYLRTDQPQSPCDCGREWTAPPNNPVISPTQTPSMTPTPSSTPVIFFTQSWLSRRDCCPSVGSPFPITYSNINILNYTPLPGRVWGVTDPFGTSSCWRLQQQITYNPVYPLIGGTLYDSCQSCLSVATPCPTTTSTTTIFQQGSGNCHCGSFECVNYVIEGDYGDSIRWRECTISINTSPIRAFFNFYYFYEPETISICSCSANLLVVSGQPYINGARWPDPPGQGVICSKKTSEDCEVCKSFFVELGESLRFKTRPIRVEYESCYAPEGGHQYPNKMMWPVSGGVTFSGLPDPLPIWAPTPMSGLQVYGRKTHLYQICSCGDTKTPDDVSNFYSPTISFWDEEISDWKQSPRSLIQSSDYLNDNQHFIWQACNHGICSCYTYDNCTTTTTTMGPCINCVPTVIGASGPGYTNITYEGCDTIVKHNIKTDFLFTGNTSSICACQRCRSWRVRPIQGADSLPYVHCCDSVFSAANYNPPPWHSSTLYNLYPQTCRTFSLNSSSLTTFKYIECNGSAIKFIEVSDPVTSPCVATISYHSGDTSLTIGSPTLCGTASVDICVSRHYYGNLSPDHASFGLITPGVFTFSSLGSCSCITSDNRYKNNTYFNYSFPGPELEYLSVTFSSSATCSDKAATNPIDPVGPQIPPCCDCLVYYFTNLKVGDIVNYVPCDTNRINTSLTSMILPKITMSGTTLSTGSFSVAIKATNFWGVGAITGIFNHNKLVIFTHSVHPSLSSELIFNNVGSYSYFSWQNTSGVNIGSVDIITITFTAQSSARLSWVNNNISRTEISDISGTLFSTELRDGWVQFPGINLPPQESFSDVIVSTTTVAFTPISPLANIVSGNFRYFNNAQTVMTNCTIEVYGTYGVSNRYTGFSFSGNPIPGGAILMATCSTNNLGQFSFSIASGFDFGKSYSLRIITNKPWGGITATDALLISRFFSVLPPPPYYTNYRLVRMVMDVNSSNTINAADALQVSQRHASVRSSFTAGDWCFDIQNASTGVSNSIASINWFIPNDVGTPANGITLNILALTFGDVNGSYPPDINV